MDWSVLTHSSRHLILLGPICPPACSFYQLESVHEDVNLWNTNNLTERSEKLLKCFLYESP